MKHIIWDLDGTLVDSYEQIIKVLENVFSQHMEFNHGQVLSFIKKESVKAYFEKMASQLGLSNELLYQDYLTFNAMIPATSYQMIEGAITTLNALKDYQHYIYTHRGASTLEILKNHQILDCFVEVITSDNGFERKPSPDALVYLVEKYGMDKELTYYVGDRSLDVLSGKHAGIKTIYYGEKNDYHANYHMTRLTDLVDLLK